MGRDQFDNNAKLGDVIGKLLLVALPADVRWSALDLVARVAEHPDVAPHIHKRWGQLSEAEGNRIAREVGIVARDVIAAQATFQLRASICTDLLSTRLHLAARRKGSASYSSTENDG